MMNKGRGGERQDNGAPRPIRILNALELPRRVTKTTSLPPAEQTNEPPRQKKEDQDQHYHTDGKLAILNSLSSLAFVRLNEIARHPMKIRLFRTTV